VRELEKRSKNAVDKEEKELEIMCMIIITSACSKIFCDNYFRINRLVVKKKVVGSIVVVMVVLPVVSLDRDLLLLSFTSSLGASSALRDTMQTDQ
jgi:hypothetical protein